MCGGSIKISFVLTIVDNMTWKKLFIPIFIIIIEKIISMPAFQFNKLKSFIRANKLQYNIINIL